MTTANPSPADYPPIPYGRAAFPSVRRDGCLYVDKTGFIRDLERERYVFSSPAAAFGKSFWLATLASYYDRRHAGSSRRCSATPTSPKRPRRAAIAM